MTERNGVTDKKRGKRTTMRATSVQNINSNKKDLSPEQREELLRALKARFEKNMNRHTGLEWAKVPLIARPRRLGLAFGRCVIRVQRIEHWHDCLSISSR